MMKQDGFLMVEILVGCFLLGILFSIMGLYIGFSWQLQRAEDSAYAANLAQCQIELLKTSKSYLMEGCGEVPWLDTNQPLPLYKKGKLFTVHTNARQSEAGVAEVVVQIDWKGDYGDARHSFTTYISDET